MAKPYKMADRTSKELWSSEGLINLIYKVFNDPGLTEEFKLESIDNIIAAAKEYNIELKGITNPIKKEEQEEQEESE